MRRPGEDELADVEPTVSMFKPIDGKKTVRDVNQPLRVHKFTYDGLATFKEPELTGYTALLEAYVEEDPGIGIFKCSDGKRRFIPLVALHVIDFRYLPHTPPIWTDMPETAYKNGIIKGNPCSWE